MARTTSIDNSDDIIDSRDVIARIEELEAERDGTISQTTCRHCGLDIEGDYVSEDWRDRGNNTACSKAEDGTVLAVDQDHEPFDYDKADTMAHWADANEDDAEELRVLVALAKDGENSADDWHHGETLIRDSYFETYAMELADDIGAIPKDAAWPMTCIDWKQAARELQMDYSAVEFDGVTYWIR